MTNSRTLRKIHVHVKAKQGMGRFKQLLNLSGNELQVKACKAELQETLATFWVSGFHLAEIMWDSQPSATNKHVHGIHNVSNADGCPQETQGTYGFPGHPPRYCIF
jgi:hypothetical protein